MLEPQGTALFVLLMVLFGVLMWRVLVTGRVVFRVLAACLAFVPAMLFGVLGVNKYYGYYQTWGAVRRTSRDRASVRRPRCPPSSSPLARSPARWTGAVST